MTWEQKLQALDALTGCALRMRKPGDWYVDQSVEIKRGSVLVGEYGGGATPEEAVNDHWAKLAESGERLVTRAMCNDRKEARWNGFMWEQLSS